MLFTLSVSGCNRLFFHPMQEEVLTPKAFGMDYNELVIKTPDNIKIHGWHLPTNIEKKGSVIFFHGNAQNISTHIASIYWLPKKGYSVYIFDYRGYGKSQGQPTIEGLIIDASSVINYVSNDIGENNIIIFGQSLGGAITINAVAQLENKTKIKAVIIDSSFAGFRQIAREKLSNFLLTWPFQYPLSLTVTSSYSPLLLANKISPIPLLVIHGNSDAVIPLHHGKNIFSAAESPKIFWEINNGKHIDSMTKESTRQHFTDFLDAAVNNRIEKESIQILLKN